jgi:hypothetical protein
MPIERERNELQFVLKDHSIHSHALTRRWNVAARIQALADPGGIYISRGAAEQVRDKVPIKIETRGEQTVKNIVRPIEAMPPSLWFWMRFMAWRPKPRAVTVEPLVRRSVCGVARSMLHPMARWRGRRPSHPSFGQSLQCFGRRQPGVSPHHIFDHGALVVRQAGQHRAIVIGQNQRRLLRFALGCHVSLIRQSHAAALSGFGLILLIVLRSTL